MAAAAIAKAKGTLERSKAASLSSDLVQAVTDQKIEDIKRILLNPNGIKDTTYTEAFSKACDNWYVAGILELIKHRRKIAEGVYKEKMLFYLKSDRSMFDRLLKKTPHNLRHRWEKDFRDAGYTDSPISHNPSKKMDGDEIESLCKANNLNGIEELIGGGSSAREVFLWSAEYKSIVIFLLKNYNDRIDDNAIESAKEDIDGSPTSYLALELRRRKCLKIFHLSIVFAILGVIAMGIAMPFSRPSMHRFKIITASACAATLTIFWIVSWYYNRIKDLQKREEN